jgi:hypothetical protein
MPNKTLCSRKEHETQLFHAVAAGVGLASPCVAAAAFWVEPGALRSHLEMAAVLCVVVLGLSRYALLYKG